MYSVKLNYHRIMKSFRYKPNFKFSIISDEKLTIEVNAICVDHGEMATIVHTFGMSSGMFADKVQFFRWLRRCIHIVELHESDEYFTVNYKKIFDPHLEDDLKRKQHEDFLKEIGKYS